ncbi:zinc finger protein 572-like isoform X2 [Leucoraja erinacea]|uniref:zinc finger protein 572-like isoform X2 n=1 Tax=Leucoraja erinaceus TaxID=7782 RepID=UPI002453A4BD|nr:zinc finger protein 572-like isoform X2 [Leucoraja erinacea]
MALSNQRVHTSGQPYDCPYCGEEFDSSRQLRQHRRTHGGEQLLATVTTEHRGCGSTSGCTLERDPLCVLSVASVTPALTTCWITDESKPASAPSPAVSAKDICQGGLS